MSRHLRDSLSLSVTNVAGRKDAQEQEQEQEGEHLNHSNTAVYYYTALAQPSLPWVRACMSRFRIVAFQTAPASERDRPGFDPRMGSFFFCWAVLQHIVPLARCAGATRGSALPFCRPQVRVEGGSEGLNS